jgi:hypothetical protein
VYYGGFSKVTWRKAKFVELDCFYIYLLDEEGKGLGRERFRKGKCNKN